MQLLELLELQLLQLELLQLRGLQLHRRGAQLALRGRDGSRERRELPRGREVELPERRKLPERPGLPAARVRELHLDGLVGGDHLRTDSLPSVLMRDSVGVFCGGGCPLSTVASRCCGGAVSASTCRRCTVCCVVLLRCIACCGKTARLSNVRGQRQDVRPWEMR